jgi:hypothetical protein
MLLDNISSEELASAREQGGAMMFEENKGGASKNGARLLCEVGG